MGDNGGRLRNCVLHHLGAFPPHLDRFLKKNLEKTGIFTLFYMIFKGIPTFLILGTLWPSKNFQICPGHQGSCGIVAMDIPEVHETIPDRNSWVYEVLGPG